MLELKLPLRIRVVYAAYNHRFSQDRQSAGVDFKLSNDGAGAVAFSLFRNREVADLGVYRQRKTIGPPSHFAPDVGADVDVLKLTLFWFDGDAGADLNFIGVVGVQIERVLSRIDFLSVFEFVHRKVEPISMNRFLHPIG